MFFGNFELFFEIKRTHWTLEAIFSCKKCPNKISAQNSNFEQNRLQRHLGPYILKSFEHVGMFKTYQKVKKQVWFYPAMLLIVSCPLLKTVYSKLLLILTAAGNNKHIVPISNIDRTSGGIENIQFRKIKFGRTLPSWVTHI